MSELGPSHAQTIIATALGATQENGAKSLAIVVLDAGGFLGSKP